MSIREHLSEGGFSTGALLAAPGTPADRAVRAVRAEVGAAWAGFAATGDPGWPVYRADEPDRTRLFGGPTAMTTEPPPDAVTAAWAAR
jgi:para-nitrobenzyl esterase